ncbi:hypothetical protein BJV82DRAFT_668730 [Fennellomyces sp. T-0311]|nr:hypothetical protein BJV82DRAFT_668730 [Fennellomyces sp. T-0311]
MAPILHGQHESRLSFHGNNLWTDLWTDLINAIRPIPAPPSRSRKIMHNRIEPLETIVHQQQDAIFESSKFQTEYVSFPRLAEEDQLQDEDSQDERAALQPPADQPPTKAATQRRISDGGSRRRLLGSSWIKEQPPVYTHFLYN